MDQIAVPDFAETYLLWNNEDSSTRYKRGIATVISHEFTHSWFGNLVTLEWWDYLFLNEGFARYYQYFATAKAEQLSDWELDKQFIVDQVQTVLVTDGSSSSAALTSKASSPTQISNKFSTISYSKGASIFRMMEHFLGTDNYHNGIRAYLTNHAWGNTNPSDLWSSIAEFALAELLPTNVTLAEVMENWVDQGGYPVITATASDNDVILSQERFVYSGTSDTEWYVPISYTLSSEENKFEDTSARVWLIPGETATLSGVLEDNDWIIVNNQESGYYRVNYDTVLWQRIEEVLLSDHTVIDVLNRAQIVDDLLNLARAGILTYSKAIEVGRYLVNETEYYPWYSAITAYNYLLRRVGEESTLGVEISALMLRLMQAVYESVSFTDLDADQHIYTLKLVLILTSACKLGHEDCVSNAKSLFEQYKNGTSIDRDLRTIVYCNGLRYSDDSTTDWEFLWEKLQSISLATEELTLIAGLGCTKNTTLLKYYLEQSLNTSSRIRLQDFASVWSAVYTSSTEGVDAAFEYFTENYESIYNYYSSSASLLSTIVGRFTTEEQLAKLEEFIASDGLSSSVKSTAESALASAKVNLAWVANIEEDLLGYFEVGEDSPSSTTEETGSSVKSAATLALILSVVFFDRLLL
ncbi:hypothetical protein NQ318_013857 [Aromia moschata]|uniref:Aminopeptidase N n=1 Tax=Aromia moschata TaxID=1265417 RepID=A0AAV8Z9A1_9CUCU|nr:hypothetical protein NQ318_013857 [Aromia moschata]